MGQIKIYEITQGGENMTAWLIKVPPVDCAHLTQPCCHIFYSKTSWNKFYVPWKWAKSLLCGVVETKVNSLGPRLHLWTCARAKPFNTQVPKTHHVVA